MNLQKIRGWAIALVVLAGLVALFIYGDKRADEMGRNFSNSICVASQQC